MTVRRFLNNLTINIIGAIIISIVPIGMIKDWIMGVPLYSTITYVVRIPLWMLIVLSLSLLFFSLLLIRKYKKQYKNYVHIQISKSLSPPFVYIRINNNVTENKVRTFCNDLYENLHAYKVRIEGMTIIAFTENKPDKKAIEAIQKENAYVSFDYIIIGKNCTIEYSKGSGSLNLDMAKSLSKEVFFTQFNHFINEADSDKKYRLLTMLFNVTKRI